MAETWHYAVLFIGIALLLNYGAFEPDKGEIKIK